LSGPVRIAFSFASHALESHNDIVLVTIHSSFPSRASVRGLVSSVPGSPPKGRGFESCLKFLNFFLRQMNYIIKRNHRDIRRPLIRITCHLSITFIPRVTSRFT
ncbi:MAG: hypothetical protein PV344_02975, partial [Anaplasma sp.]|nr:hypothetical protein [Anaplasma sp.]